MSNFAVVEGELVPIDASGNPLPIAQGGTLGSTPGLVVGGKRGTLFSMNELRRVGNENALVTTVPDYFTTDFGEVRTAAPYTLADLNFKYDIDPTEWATSTATGGTVTYVSASGTARLAVTGTNGSQAFLRTQTYFRYQSGKQLAALITVYHDNAGVANQTRRWGIKDSLDGMFFELSGTTLQLSKLTSTSGTAVASVVASRASWIDPLNGSGPSGVTLDLTQANIYEIHYQWLGAGTVRFFINGILVYKLENANTLSVPYMRTGQLPMSVEVINTASSTAAGMNVICTSVKALGGDDPPYYTYGARNTADISVTATERPILSIRPRLIFPSGSIENRMIVLPRTVSVKTEGVRSGFSIWINPTLTGASWSDVNTTRSCVEFDVAATSFTGGELIYNEFMPNTNSASVIRLDNVFSILGRKLRRDAFLASADILTITGYAESAGTTLMRASVNWGEIR